MQFFAQNIPFCDVGCTLLPSILGRRLPQIDFALPDYGLKLPFSKCACHFQCILNFSTMCLLDNLADSPICGGLIIISLSLHSRFPVMTIELSHVVKISSFGLCTAIDCVLAVVMALTASSLISRLHPALPVVVLLL